MITLLFLVTGLSASSQHIPFRFYNTSDGLLDNTVYSLAVDHRGYTWLGTGLGGVFYINSNGLNSYLDPAEIRNAGVRELFFTEEGLLFIGTENGLFSSDGITTREVHLDTSGIHQIIEIYQDQDNNIWIGTSNAGIFFLRKKEDGPEYEKATKVEGLNSEAYFAISSDEDGRIWGGGFGGGIDFLHVQDDTIVAERSGIILHAQEKLITSLLPLKTGKMLIGNYGMGVIGLSESGEEYERFLLPGFDLLSEEIIWDLEPGEQNTFYAATDKSGIWKIEKGRSLNYSTINGLPSNSILDVMVNSGTLWMGSNGYGIGQQIWPGIRFYPTSAISGAHVISSLSGVDKRTLAIGTSGNGIIHMDMISGEAAPALYHNNLRSSDIKSLQVLERGGLLAGTGNEGLYLVEGGKINHYDVSSGLSLNSVNTVYQSKDKRIWAGTSAGLTIFSEYGLLSLDESQSYGIPNNEVQCLEEDYLGRMWIGTMDGIAFVKGEQITTYGAEDGLSFGSINTLCAAGDVLWIGTNGDGIYYSLINKDTLQFSKFPGSESMPVIHSIASVSDSLLLIGSNRGIEILCLDGQLAVVEHRLIDLEYSLDAGDPLQNGAIALQSSLVTFATTKGLISISVDELMALPGDRADIFLEDIEITVLNKQLNVDSSRLVPWQKIPSSLKLKHDENYLLLELASNLSGKSGYKIEYRLKDDNEQSWIKINADGIVILNNIRFGKYTLQARVTDPNEAVISKILSYPVIIKPPFYLTWWFLVIMGVLILVATYTIIRVRERQLVRQNLLLEKTVEERTYEIVQQKDQISLQKEEIEQKNQDITDSLNYASKIQQALLPSRETLQKNFKDSFILYRPRDIVSGDFYWMDERDDKTICVLADCTGHGVPGAFLSMLGMSLLNEIVEKNGITAADQILNSLRKEIIRTLKQVDPEGQKDGMDISVCVFDKKSKMMEFSGGNNSILILRNNEIIELKADKMPVAIYYIMDPFTLNQVELESGDNIYMFSDGYIDQFGGELGKKFMKKPFKRLLIEISSKSMKEQGEILERTLDEWMKNYSQVDDISVIGIKYS